jgi:hypothetical protein
VTIGGYPGKLVDATVPADISGCSSDGGPQFRVWGYGIDDARWAQGPSEHDRMRVMDVDGDLFVLHAHSFPGTSATDVAELEAIVGSIQLAP